MKKRFFTILAILAILALVLTGCPKPDDPEDPDDPDNPNTGGDKSKAALLTALKFDAETIKLGAAIAGSAWGTADLANLSSAQEASYQLSAATKGITIAATVSDKATAKFAVTTDATKPATFAADTGVTITAGGFLVVEVTAEDGTTKNYYAVRIELTGTNTTLSGLTITKNSYATEEKSFISGSRNAQLSGITAYADINLSDAEKDGAAISLNIPTAFGTGVASIAKLAEGTNVPADTDFTTYNKDSKPTFNFTDGDRIFVKMTAANGVNVMYYAYVVYIGRDATLSDTKGIYFKVTLSGIDRDVDDVDITLGAPAGTVAALDALPAGDPGLGKAQFNTSGSAFKVFVTTNDSGATAKISTTGTSNWVTPGGTAITFSATVNAVYVEVVSSNTKVTQYYKIEIVLQRSIEIPYGQPTTLTVDAALNDTAWNDATDWLYIDRVNTTETQDILQMDAKDRTFGRAKLMFDADGIYVYAQVWEKNVTYAAQMDDGGHNYSSVELFINENPTATSGSVTGGQNGGQYRLGANAAMSGANTTAMAAFRTLNRKDAKIYTAGTFPVTAPTTVETNVTSGYIVIFQAPWRFASSTFPLSDGKKLSIELQINAIGPNDTRVGILNWNNKNSNSYNSLANYGQATLNLGNAQLPAVAPAITTQPAASTKIPQNSTDPLPALSVVASTTDGGALTYQWYYATTAATTTAGTAITGATTASYTLGTTALVDLINVTTLGDHYYYVVVTNTKGTGATATTNTTTSSRAKVSVIDPALVAVDLELVNDEMDKWDDDALVVSGGTNVGGLVIEKGTASWEAYQGVVVVSLPIDTKFDADSYQRIELTFVGYKADGSIASPATSQWSADFVPVLTDGTTSVNFGWNATSVSTVQVGGKNASLSLWNLTTANGGTSTLSDGKWTIDIQPKNGTNTIAAGQIVKLVVTSVKLIAQ